MVLYSCERCLKVFDRKSNYDYHLNRKFKCKDISELNYTQMHINAHENFDVISTTPSIQSEENDEELNFQNLSKKCLLCNKIFSRLHSLHRHQETFKCQIILDLQTQLSNQQEVIEKQSKIIENQNKIIDEKLRKSSGKNSCASSTNNGTIVNGNVENMVNNIYVVAFGKEDISKLNQDEIKAIMEAKYGAMAKYVEYTHLNDRLPEHQNILVSNLRSNDCKVISDDNTVEVRDLEYTVDKIIQKGVEGISNFLEEEDLDLEEAHIEKIKSLLQNMSSKDKGGETITKKIKEQIKRLLYQNRKKVAKNIKSLE